MSITYGIETNNVKDIKETLEIAKLSKANFIAVPLFHPRFRRDSSHTRLGPGTRSDRVLDCQDWTSKVIGKISDWISFTRSDPQSQKDTDLCFHQEMSWAVHLGLQAILLPSPSIIDPHYCKSLLQYCSSTSYQQFFIRIPITQPLRSENISSGHENTVDGWVAWNNFRLLTGHIHNISVALEIFDAYDDLSVYEKWTAEPVKALILPTEIFIANKSGFPVLPKTYQLILRLFFKFKINVILKGRPRFLPSTTDVASSSARSDNSLNTTELIDDYTLYVQYINHLRERYLADISGEDRLIASYKDRLQYPLQPLMDNLEAQTYETFERDTIKYTQYEQAIVSALHAIKLRRDALSDLSADRSSLAMSTEEVGESDQTVVITVVGAGRGPLVASALAAAAEVGVAVRIYAVEKNENAVITLRNRVLTAQWTNVTVIHTDMRDWQPPEKADIMVLVLI